MHCSECMPSGDFWIYRRGRYRFETSRQGTQNLIDSYTEMVLKVLEVLPSETRYRICKIPNLMVTVRPDVTPVSNVVVVEGPQDRTRGLVYSYRRTPCLPLATGFRSACAEGFGSEVRWSRRSREGTVSAL
jgi:hypothetical protein